ncbi:MAG: phage holin family protein [Verrucomicrobiota bacterium]
MIFENSFGGLFASLRRVTDTGVEMVKNRLELATLELKEEKSRMISAAIWGGIFIFSSFMAIIASACTFLFIFWEQRLYVALGLLAFCLLGALTAFLSVKKKTKSPAPFAETISQLKKDRAWLQKGN